MTEQLKPCPFCGGINITNSGLHKYCHSCGAEGPDADSGTDAALLAAWNRRTQPAQEVPSPPEDWHVFNNGAQVAGGLTWAEAWDYMTPERIDRGWTAVCVADKSNLPAAPQQKGST